MKKSITDEKTNISYTLVGDIYLPNLVMPRKKNYQLGRFGRMHKQWLKENHKSIYSTMLMSCKLDDYLYNIDQSAQKQYNIFVEQFKQAQGITEELKAKDQMAWVQAMNNIENQVKEIICNQIIYSV